MTPEIARLRLRIIEQRRKDRAFFFNVMVPILLATLTVQFAMEVWSRWPR